MTSDIFLHTAHELIQTYAYTDTYTHACLHPTEINK